MSIWFTGLADIVEDAVVGTDAEFRVALWNRGAERLYGYSADEALGRDARDIASWGDTSRVELERELRESGRVRVEIAARRKDGTTVEVELIAVVVHGSGGEIAGYAGSHRDVTEQAEEALHASQRQTETILQSIGEAFIALDRDWRYIYLNDRALRRLEVWLGRPVTRQEILGRNIWELFPDVLGTDVERRLREGMQGDEPVEFELYFPPTGEWVETTLYPSPDGLTVYYRSITDRKRAEEERREAQRRTEAVLESVSDAFFALDREWRLTYVNARAAAVFAELRGGRLTREQLVGRDVWQLFPAVAGTTAQELLERAMRDQLSVEFEYLYPGAGRWFDVHCYPSADGLSVYFGDITQRKHEEQQLAYLASLLDNVDDAVIASDEQLVVTAWNKAAERMFGWSAAEAIGRRVSEVARSDSSDDEQAAAVSELQRTGRGRSERVRYARDGTPVHAEVITVVLHDDHGASNGYLGILRDVAERRRAEAERGRWARQQAVLAHLGQRALAHHDDIQSLMDEAVALVARTLDVDLVKLAETLPDHAELLVRAGVGWRPGVVGRATEPAGGNSQAGYVLEAGAAVVAADIAAETRFLPSRVVWDHGVVSAVAVAVGGGRGRFGVLEALTTTPRAFSDSDINFLQAVANVLATTIERAALTERLQEVKESERRRLARDLHDQALTDLSDALAEASRAEAAQAGPEAAAPLGRVVPALKRVGEQLRAAIYDLRLDEEQNRPFRDLLEELVEVHRGREGDAEIQLTVGQGVPADPLGATGTEVLRILGEALTNARLHARARKIRVDVWGTAAELGATVSDDGRGFDAGDPPRPGGGIGLTTMRERADLLGADLQVSSPPGAGAEVRVEVSLRPPAGAPAPPVRVLLVEDHASVREAVAVALEREPDFQVSGQAATLAEARTMLEGVDVAIIDLGLPDGDGAELIKELRRVSPAAQAIVLSAGLERAEMAGALEQGAAGALDKTVHLDEVAAAVRRLRAGENLLSVDEVIALVGYARRRRDGEAEARRAIEQLTDREREVLQALAEGLSSQAIAERLHITVRTERNHVANILSKLDVHSQLQALVFALRHGVVELREPGAVPPPAPSA